MRTGRRHQRMLLMTMESALPLPVAASSSSSRSRSRSSSGGGYLVAPLTRWIGCHHSSRSPWRRRSFPIWGFSRSSSSDGRRNCIPCGCGWAAAARKNKLNLSGRGSSSSSSSSSRVYAAIPNTDPDGGDSSSWKQQPCYHPLEEIEETLPCDRQDGGDKRLTYAETARTIIEVNSKATIIFSGMIDEAHENIFWPDLPYLIDEYGDIYFEVNDDQDTLHSLNADDKLLQVIIGTDNIEVLNEVEVMEPSDFDFSMEEITSDDSDIDDVDEEDFIAIFEDDEDNMISSETLGNWANLDTMRSSHPMYFANKITEALLDDHLDWMDQPSASIVIQGLLRPVFIEESAAVGKYPSRIKTNNKNICQLGKVVDHNIEEELEKNQRLQSGITFYKLEMININLVSAYGNQSTVKVQDFRKAKPDVLAHSAANIICRLKDGGEKMIQAFKSLCWRQKSVQIEEAAVSGVDSLGFDLRVCSGTQIQTLRFAFSTRANSEFSAERQIHDILFPRFLHKQQIWPQANQKEC